MERLRQWALRWFALSSQGWVLVGEHNLLMVSVGTGLWERKTAVDYVAERKIWDWAKDLASLVMDEHLGEPAPLQFLSRSATPWEIDREVGDLSGDLLTPEPALTYCATTCGSRPAPSSIWAPRSWR